MAKFLLLEWMWDWLLNTPSFEFEWDKGNSTKSLVKHKVTTQEVEEVFLGRVAVPLGKRIKPQDSEDRYGIIGPTWHERLLMIVFTFRGEKVRAISSRPASKKERKTYDKVRKITKRVQ